jgi:hypothetical protein
MARKIQGLLSGSIGLWGATFFSFFTLQSSLLLFYNLDAKSSVLYLLVLLFNFGSRRRKLLKYYDAGEAGKGRPRSRTASFYRNYSTILRNLTYVDLL